jgi:hypothetical protein
MIHHAILDTSKTRHNSIPTRSLTCCEKSITVHILTSGGASDVTAHSIDESEPRALCKHFTHLLGLKGRFHVGSLKATDYARLRKLMRCNSNRDHRGETTTRLVSTDAT